MRVESFSGEHVVEAAEIFREVFTKAPWRERWTEEEALARIRSLAAVRSSRGWALMGTTMAAFAIGAVDRQKRGGQPHLVLEEMAVRPGKQRAGLGSALLNVIETQMRSEDIARIDVLTAAKKWPRRFYEKNGFTFCCLLGEGDVLLNRAIESKRAKKKA